MRHKKSYEKQYKYLELLKIKLEKEGKSLSVKDELEFISLETMETTPFGVEV